MSAATWRLASLLPRPCFAQVENFDSADCQRAAMGPFIHLPDKEPISMIALLWSVIGRDGNGFPVRSIDRELVHGAKELLLSIKWSLPAEISDLNCGQSLKRRRDLDGKWSTKRRAFMLDSEEQLSRNWHMVESPEPLAEEPDETVEPEKDERSRAEKQAEVELLKTSGGDPLTQEG